MEFTKVKTKKDLQELIKDLNDDDQISLYIDDDWRHPNFIKECGVYMAIIDNHLVISKELN